MSVQVYSAVIILLPCILAQIDLTLNEGIPGEQRNEVKSEARGFKTLERILQLNSSTGPHHLGLNKSFPKTSEVNLPKEDSVHRRESRRIHLLPGEPSIKDGCPITLDGHRRYRCPLSRVTNICITDHQLCNGKGDCPYGEDEEPTICFFYRFINDNIRLIFQGMIQKGFERR